jgi:hypothetical protein
MPNLSLSGKTIKFKDNKTWKRHVHTFNETVNREFAELFVTNRNRAWFGDDIEWKFIDEDFEEDKDDID